MIVGFVHLVYIGLHIYSDFPTSKPGLDVEQGRNYGARGEDQTHYSFVNDEARQAW